MYVRRINFNMFIVLTILLMLTSQGLAQSDSDWQRQAAEMVKNQIIARGIKDFQLIKVLEETPRHRFVPPEYEREAYQDYPLPIGWGQTISQPFIVAIMTSMCELTGKEKVLEIGTGSGYQAAILSQLAKTVYTIEIIEPLAQQAEKKLKELGYHNVNVRRGDGYQGWPEAAPFDCIVVTAAPPEIPQALSLQLAIDGKMAIPVGEDYQELLLIRKTKNGVEKKSVIPVRFVPMIHEFN
jgi:protein-L-isoaspartate(D-aspartate) O-methyltransferase